VKLCKSKSSGIQSLISNEHGLLQMSWRLRAAAEVLILLRQDSMRGSRSAKASASRAVRDPARLGTHPFVEVPAGKSIQFLPGGDIRLLAALPAKQKPRVGEELGACRRQALW
jgi:hypothetical protein